ncbi:MAG: bifunctional tRNA (5-methylaminomethyl-2-thiouridine)(34)-methyltransferase MnmD/FAD-dependent 5-carboxymethylaminomethyl-2-thiouridine(34) oxidoreductase MnmC [Burkholderiaceae bacterium]
MAFDPIRATPLAWDANGVPFSHVYGDVYHPAAGAAGQARHVFLGGNQLPQRWQGKARFVVLETGFGLGNNFLATWQAWRDDARRCSRLHFIAIEKHPLTRADLGAAHATSPWPELAKALLQAWPPLTPDLHSLQFDDGKVELLLALGDVQRWLPQLVAHVDAFYLDGFAPARNPAMWEPLVFKALARLAAPQATLATWSVAKVVGEGLRAAGFHVEQVQGFGGKREMSAARFDPIFTPRRSLARQPVAAPAANHAVVVGAGLAGCATAWALAQQGWTTTLLDRCEAAAQEASGNSAGAFHGIVNRQDGAHSRFNRAAALDAHRMISHAVQSGGVAGHLNGLLRLESRTPDIAAMRAIVQALALPDDYVRVLDAAQASQLSGVSLQHPAWFYPGGGCVDPAGLARHFLELSRSTCTLRAGREVATIRRHADVWQLFDSSGALIEAAHTVVLCNAADALRLLGQPAWPLRSLRGQVSMLPVAGWPSGSAPPRMAITGEGYVLPQVNGRILFGATSADADADPCARESDHRANLERLARLVPLGQPPSVDALQGRVGWRCASLDRLPVIGAVPREDSASPARDDQPRRVAREAGLFVFVGLGSRGITWSALGGRLLASWITGAPAPVPANLIDAVDPARFVTRRARRRNQGAGVPGLGAELPPCGSAGSSS